MEPLPERHPSRRKGLALDPILAIREALAARNAGRPDLGVPLVQAALRSHPRDARLWQTRGLIHRALEDSASAVEAFAEAARLAPSDAKISHGRARATLEAGRPAVALFDQAWQLAPGNADVLLGRAAAQVAEGHGEQAIADLDAVLQNNPDWVAGHALLSNLRWTLGERTRFADSWRRALRQRPSSPHLWSGLVDQLLQAGRYADADAIVAEARQALGASLALDVSEACCATELGDAGRADRIFSRPEVLREPAVAPWYMRHLLRTGRPDEAARFGEPLTDSALAGQVWPYLAVAWRLTQEPRWQWLEADPRLIGVYDIGAGAELVALAERLRALHNTVAHPIGQSVRGGTQTDGPLFARIEPEIRALRGRIVEAVEGHVRSLGTPDPSHPVLRHRPELIRFAGSWSVRLTGAGHHTNHIHPQGWLSSAFYVSVPPEAELGAAPAGWLSLGQPPEELGLDLPPIRRVEPKPGRLVLFPSIMWHGTAPFEGGERLTVAFDVAPPAGS